MQPNFHTAALFPTNLSAIEGNEFNEGSVDEDSVSLVLMGDKKHFLSFSSTTDLNLCFVLSNLELNDKLYSNALEQLQMLVAVLILSLIHI